MPGQGAIGQCSIALATGGLGDALVESMNRGTPYLGTSPGSQCPLERSEDAPGVAGLGYFRGDVKRFAGGQHDEDGRLLKVPHMGWNDVVTSHPFLVPQGYYYFVHSFHCVPEDASIIAATTDYGGPSSSAIAKDTIFACQFHPEKSHRLGARLLERYLEA